MARAMKDSGVEWIGQIPVEWDVHRNKVCFSCGKEIVGEISKTCQLLSLTTKGVVKKDKNITSGKLPETFDTYQLVTSNDLVMCLFDLDCSAVFSGISKYDGMISPAYKVLSCQEQVLPEYADKWFSFVFDGRKFMHYAKNLRYTLNYDEFAVLPMLLPPKEAQKQISVYLDTRCAKIDAVIEKTKASIEEYKKLKQAIITQAVTKGIRGDRPMKESGIAWISKIPAGWNSLKIGSLYSQRNKKVSDRDYAPLSVTMQGIVPQLATAAKTDDGDNRKFVETGDFVINSRSDRRGSCGISDYDGSVSLINLVLTPRAMMHPGYYNWLFHTALFADEFYKWGHGIVDDLWTTRWQEMKSIYVPVPPIEEQQEIMRYLCDKADEINVLIHKKEQYLAELESYRKSLIYEYVTGKKEVPQEQYTEAVIAYPYFPAIIKASSPRFAQAVLMSKVLDECKTKMGRVKLEKMMFVLESNIGFDFDTEYVREAAGPLDKSLYACEGIISKKNKWFTINQSRGGVSYRPTKNVEGYKKYYDQYFSEYQNAINQVIDIFKDFDANQAEVIATLYGAWNDLIIDKRNYTDTDIVDEVLNHWHPKKRRFPKEMWLRAIQKMRELDLVPHGYGRHTIVKQN